MSQLREQKAILAIRKLQAEKNMRIHWNELKDAFRPGRLAAEAFENIQHTAGKERDEKNILKNTFAYGLTLLAQKIVSTLMKK